MQRTRRPREANADELAEQSNRQVESLGIERPISGNLDSHGFLDDLEPHETDVRANVPNPRADAGDLPFKNLKG